MTSARVAVAVEEARRSPRAGSADALADAGVALARRGRFEEAAASLRRALALDPGHGAALPALAGVYATLARPAELVEACRGIVAARPDHFEAHHRMGEALAFLRRFAESAESFGAAAGLVPRSQSAHKGLGVALAGLGRDAEAVASFRAALALDPGYVDALTHLGRALCRLGAKEEALDRLDAATRLDPASAGAHHARGIALDGLRRYEEAIAAYDRALALEPGHVDARKDRGLARLMLGDYRRGWADYESRWRLHDVTLPPYPQPLWKGEPVEGGTILLGAEQGVGDVLQFVRYAPMVKALGASVALHVPEFLIPLLETCPGIDRLVARVEPGATWFDVHVPLMNLPTIFGTTPATVPAPIPYLAADPSRVARWRSRLAEAPGFLVGVAWQGNPANSIDRDRSFPLSLLEPLARVAGIRLVSLQKGPGAAQIGGCDVRFPLVDFGDALDAEPGAFLDTAAIMASLDLVVSADTATAHLAGALGVPVWVPLSFAADWRWGLDGETSTWYPSARLFRQGRRGEWGPVFERMAGALAGLVARGPITIEVAAGELIDKITILEIKAERITDGAKLRNVRAELDVLESARSRSIPPMAGLDALTADLKAVNIAIWDVEDALRASERAGDFGPEFVALARSVYRNNDRRAAIKRAINDRLGSRLIEEKSYPEGWPTP